MTGETPAYRRTKLTEERMHTLAEGGQVEPVLGALLVLFIQVIQKLFRSSCFWRVEAHHEKVDEDWNKEESNRESVRFTGCYPIRTNLEERRRIN